MTDKEVASFLREIKDRNRGYYIVKNVDEENFVTYRIERWDFTKRKGDELDAFYKDIKTAKFILDEIFKSLERKKGEEDLDHGKF